MRQLIYASTSSCAPGKADLDGILESSRHNNALDGITGLLCADASRYIQVFEGPRVSVEQTFARIKADPRHHGVTILSDRAIDDREFGSWAMAYRDLRLDALSYNSRVQRLLIDAPEPIRAHFDAFARSDEFAMVRRQFR